MVLREPKMVPKNPVFKSETEILMNTPQTKKSHKRNLLTSSLAVKVILIPLGKKSSSKVCCSSVMGECWEDEA